MKLNKKFMLNSSMELSKIISSQIAKVKIYVMYDGKNRNSTHFSRRMIEDKLVPSMYGMPIIGEYSKEKQDFGGHGGKITITDDGAEYEQTTVAYGFIPESSQMKWETVTETNGTKREYLTCDGYVWYKRFPEVGKILDEPSGQSMEIEIFDAKWDEQMKAYDILDAEFTGACILGVEPCFESAKIGKFNLEEMKFTLSEMAQELKQVIKDSEVNNMEETNVVETVEVTEVIDVAEVEVAEVATETEPVVEATEVETAEFADQTGEEPAEEETEAEGAQEIVEKLAEEVNEMIETAPENTEETAIENAVEAVEEVAVAVEELQEAIDNPVEETQEETAFENQEETETVNFEKENAELRAEIESLKAELVELKEYRTARENAEKEALIESFGGEFTEEEFAPVKEKMEEVSKEELETQLFALLGKKKMNYTAVKKTDVNKKVVALVDYELEDNLPSWAKAIEQHKKSKQK